MLERLDLHSTPEARPQAGGGEEGVERPFAFLMPLPFPLISEEPIIFRATKFGIEKISRRTQLPTSAKVRYTTFNRTG